MRAARQHYLRFACEAPLRSRTACAALTVPATACAEAPAVHQHYRQPCRLCGAVYRGGGGEMPARRQRAVSHGCLFSQGSGLRLPSELRELQLFLVGQNATSSVPAMVYRAIQRSATGTLVDVAAMACLGAHARSLRQAAAC